MNAIISTITAFARYRVAPNVLMLVFMLVGIYALTKLTVRFFPNFEVSVIVTSVVWEGASPSDIEESIIVPLENALRSVPDYNKFYSYSRENVGTVILEFPDSVDLSKALEDIKTEVDQATLPSDSKQPTVVLAEAQDLIMKLALTGNNRNELREVARKLEQELNQLNVSKVKVNGIPKQQINVLVDQSRLIELDLTLEQIGRAITAQNRDASIGSITGLGNERQLRASSKTAELIELELLPITASRNRLILLRDVAVIERKDVKDRQILVTFDEKPAVEFVLTATKNTDFLVSAEQVLNWMETAQKDLPPGFEILPYDQQWEAVESRINLLINNGLSGLVLVLLVLFLFLSPKVAFWVAAGIPVAMFATLFAFQLLGGTINMISVFALIMGVGLVVDDAIVVAENAQSRLSSGQPPMRSVISAANSMSIPVFASSLTTIAAFLPLFLVSGPIGQIIYDIPIIIVCILIAANIECFLILPGHLYHSFGSNIKQTPSRFRQSFDRGFNNFRQNLFRPLVTLAVRYNVATIVTCFMLLVLSISLLTNGFVSYRFFPGAEGSKVFAEVRFNSGTPREVLQAYVEDLLIAMHQTDTELTEQVLVQHVASLIGKGDPRRNIADGNEKALIEIELIQPGERDITVSEFTKAWKANATIVPGLELLDIHGESSGPPGRDIEVLLSSLPISQVKEISGIVQDALLGIPGITSVGDDTPYGKEEFIFELTPLGRSLNLKVADVANQLRYATDGYLVQTFTEGVDEIELRVLLANFSEDVLNPFQLRLPTGQYIPLTDIVSWRITRGFETIVRQSGSTAIVVQGDLNPNAKTTVGEVITELEQGVLADLRKEFGVNYSFEGKNKDEQQTGKEMGTGLLLAGIIIYITLTLVFNSWSLPVIVMLTMPLGIIGTIAGHWIMGVQMSILSFFGMFTLMGIIVNNAIVLVRTFIDFREDTANRDKYDEMIVTVACLRLRPVLLTSFTTIGGLTPLMFETSLQAQFLLPMAISICFGLGFATIIILLFTPACMSLQGIIELRKYKATSRAFFTKTA